MSTEGDDSSPRTTFLEGVKSYSFSFDAITSGDRAMNATFLSFSTIEIHYRDTTATRSTKERKKLFGTYSVLSLFMVCELELFLIS